MTPLTILCAEDDPDDRLLLADAAAEALDAPRLQFVDDGLDLFDYLYRRGRWEGTETTRPALILLDLNMPRLDGRGSLIRLKADAGLRHIPVVVLTTSKAEADVFATYDAGASSYIVKPVTFAELVAIMRGLAQYWTDLVRLPLDRPVWEVER